MTSSLATKPPAKRANGSPQAIDHALTNHTGNLAITTHGTVISLFVAHKNNTNGFDLWQRLNLPSFVVLNRTTFELIDVIEKIPFSLL
jgi:broad specificity phosphatase PhoE